MTIRVPSLRVSNNEKRGRALNLNFVDGSAFDPRITFSRTSNATLTGSDGLIQYAPNNLLTFSEQFDNAAWNSAAGITITANASTAPDGTVTADRLAGNTASWYMQQNPTTTVGVVHTISFYVKSNTGISQNFRLFGAGSVTSGNLTATTSWQRFNLSFTASSTIAAAGITRDSAGNTNDLLIWGAQLNVGSLQPYYPTTTAAYYGPRFDYDPITLACKGLLIEEQRVNLLTYSEDFSNAAWTSVGGTVTPNSTTAPDGTLTADTFVSTGSDQIFQVGTVTSGATATLSFYLKKSTYDWVRLTLLNGANEVRGWFNLSSGVVGTQNVSGTGVAAGISISSVGNNWFRCVISGSIPAATAYTGVIASASADASFTRVAGNRFQWGAQLEAGAFATSYIPTVASQVTRTADNASMTGTNFSSWYNASEGTILGEGYSAGTASGIIAMISDGTVSNNNVIAHVGSTNGANINTGGVLQANFASLGTWNVNAFAKIAMAMKLNDSNAALNGTLGTTDTSCTLGAVTRMDIGSWVSVSGVQPLNGTIKSISYYPRRLTNQELQAITS